MEDEHLRRRVISDGSTTMASVPSGSGDTGPMPEGSGEAETVPSESVKTEIRPSLSRQVASTVFRSLLWVSLILKPDSSLRAYGGVGYSIIGFF